MNLKNATDLLNGDRKHSRTQTAQDESQAWLKSNITTIQATH